MDTVDYQQLATPLEGEEIAGPDLEYDADFLKIIDILAPSPVTMVASQDDGLPDQTDWNGAASLCETVLNKTRDLRVAVRLARTSVKSDGGIAGFSGAVSLIAELVENMWESVHPVLDDEDDMDATMRFNALNELSDAQVIKSLSFAPIASVGRETLSLNDIEISIGKAHTESSEEQSIASGRTAEIFAPANQDRIMTAKAAADSALSDIARIQSNWSSKMDALGQSRSEEGLSFDNIPSPQYEGLIRVLGDISRHIAERLPQEESAISGSEDGELATGVKKTSGAITTRADADRAILNLVDWFHRNEPSSPVPIMLERARSMISKSFLEIVEDLGEGGIAEARKTTQTPKIEE